ncbi:MAG: AMP-binding protein [Cyanobacteria bacterium LVE1205-1]
MVQSGSDGFVGGAPVWDQLLQESRRKGIRVTLTYGMTETASQVTALKPEEFSQGRTGCGRALPHAKVRIIDEGGGSCQLLK